MGGVTLDAMARPAELAGDQPFDRWGVYAKSWQDERGSRVAEGGAGTSVPQTSTSVGQGLGNGDARRARPDRMEFPFHSHPWPRLPDADAHQTQRGAARTAPSGAPRRGALSRGGPPRCPYPAWPRRQHAWSRMATTDPNGRLHALHRHACSRAGLEWRLADPIRARLPRMPSQTVRQTAPTVLAVLRMPTTRTRRQTDHPSSFVDQRGAR